MLLKNFKKLNVCFLFRMIFLCGSNWFVGINNIDLFKKRFIKLFVKVLELFFYVCEVKVIIRFNYLLRCYVYGIGYCGKCGKNCVSYIVSIFGLEFEWLRISYFFCDW